MTTGSANRWIVASAAGVAGIYGYTVLKGTNTHNPAQFVTAWGFVFFLIALIANGAPGFAAALAILVLVVDLLDNAQAVIKSVLSAEKGAVGGGGSSALPQLPSVTGRAPRKPAAFNPYSTSLTPNAANK